MNEARCWRLINRAIDTFDLNLSDLAVLTEAATGYYMLTPLIAALAGAEIVYALTRDSRYGSAQVVCEQTMALAERWSVAQQIEVLFSREDKRVGLADIVTNLGFVRPLDAPFLKRLKRTAVIPLMFEPWEYRPEDLDLAECRRQGIPVLGTNEHHPDMQIFEYVGHLVLKLLFELDIEVFRSKVIIIGGGEFGRCVLESLQNAGASVTQVRVAEGESLQSLAVRQALSSCDAIVVVEHHSRELLIGRNGQIPAEELRKLDPGVSIVHVAGGVNQEEVEAIGIPCRPDCFAPPGYMSVATDYLGPRPLIDLHAAGLKVGELMWRKMQVLGDAEQVEHALAEEHPLCQCLPEEG